MANPYHDILTSVIDHSINGGRNATGQMDDSAQGAVKALTGHAKDIENAGNAGGDETTEEQPAEPEGGDTPPGAPGAPPAAPPSGSNPLMQAYLRKVLEAAGEGPEEEENPEGEGTDETNTDDDGETKDNVENVRVYRTASGKILFVDNCGGKGGTKGPCKGSGKGATATVKEPSASKPNTKIASEPKTPKSTKPSASRSGVTPTKGKESKTPTESPSKSTGDNCGIGKGGFQKGNACAKGGNSGPNEGSTDTHVDDANKVAEGKLSPKEYRKKLNKLSSKEIDGLVKKLGVKVKSGQDPIDALVIGAGTKKSPSKPAPIATKSDTTPASKTKLQGVKPTPKTTDKTTPVPAEKPTKTAQKPIETKKQPKESSDSSKISSGKGISREDFSRELNQAIAKAGDSKNDTEAVNEHVARLLDKYSKPGRNAVYHRMKAPEDFRELEIGGLKIEYSEKAKSEASSMIPQLLNKDVLPDRIMGSLHRVIFSSSDNTVKVDGKIHRHNASADDKGNVCFYKNGVNMSTLAHEAGHLIAAQKWNDFTPPPDSEYGKAQKQEKPVTAYGATQPLEDFADAVRLYAIDRNNFKKNFPKKYAAVEKIMSEESGREERTAKLAKDEEEHRKWREAEEKKLRIRQERARQKSK